jgi:hypothetical protein
MFFSLLGGEEEEAVMEFFCVWFGSICRQICLEEEEALAVTRQAPDLVGQLGVLYLAG